MKNKVMFYIKSILFFGWALFLAFLMYQSLFVFPLTRTAWGYNSDYLVITMIMIAITISLWNMLRISKFEKESEEG